MLKQISTTAEVEPASSADFRQRKPPGSLADLYAEHVGKVSDKWSSYLDAYDEHFASRRLQPLRLLEIGIQNGGSLDIWAKYFPRAVALVGCDIDPSCAQLRYEDPRVRIVIGDANTDEAQASIAKNCACFDIIIDDGSHRSADIIQSFARYFPRLVDGGIYAIEDLHCSYWDEFGGGVADPASSMALLKRLADVIHHEHWGIASQRAALLRSFAEQYSVQFDEASLAGIRSIQFLNSLCFIEKERSDSNGLGRRFVVGEVACAEAAPLAAEAHLATPDQSSNPLANLERLPETELASLRSGRAALETRLAELAAEITQGQRREEALLASASAGQKALRMEQAKLQIRVEHAKSLSIELAEVQARCVTLERAALELQASERRLHEVLRSHSWQATAPVRWMSTQCRRIVRAAIVMVQAYRSTDSAMRLTRRGLGILQRQGWQGLRGRLRDAGGVAGRPAFPWGPPQTGEDVARAIFARQQAELTAAEAKRCIQDFELRPLISVVMPVYKTPVEWLRRAVESLQGQFYENWELCAVDDCSPTDEQANTLRQLAAVDSRVRFSISSENAGISAASNASLAMSRGEYVALLDHDDELTPDALFRVVEAINEDPLIDFVYTDECKIDDTYRRELFHFIFKPDWSPEILFNGMLTGHLTVYSKSLVDRLGGFRSAYDFSQDYDLALRAGETATRIRHIERVLYLWRSIPGSAASGGKDFARTTNVAALDDALARRGIPGIAVPLPHANYVKLDPRTDDARVSIIVPSDSVDNLRTVIRSICKGTSYANYELVLVCNGPLAERLADEFHEFGQLKFVHYNKKYNFSDKCNEGARAADGDILVFYNDDVYPLQEDWIERLVEYLAVPGIGCVSPKLLHDNDTIQYAGMISGAPGLAGTAYNNVHRDACDPFLSMHKYVRNVSLLSGACCAFRSEVFWAVGAFDAVNTPDGHSDMDLSFRLLDHGYRCLYTPYAVLRHVGNHSWGAKRHKYKADIHMLKRWGGYLEADPYFTASMKDVLYHDFRFEYRISAGHIDPARTYSGPDVLFLSHELSHTGAPRMLLNAAVAVVRDGGFAVVVSPMDGPLRDELERNGVVVIIDASVPTNHFLFERFARNFDVVVANTIDMRSAVHQLSKIEDLRILWWLHEAKSLGAHAATFRTLPAHRVTLIAVSEYARQYLPQELPVEILYNGIAEESRPVCPHPPERKFTFLLAGTIEPRKAQDLFVEAISVLPADVGARCRFLMAGKLWPMHEDYWNAIRIRMQALPTVEYLGALDHDAVLDAVADADVLVCCSRDEPFPLVVLEAAMLHKPAILSTAVGSAEVFGGGDAAPMVFKSEDTADLAGKLLWAYENSERIVEAGTAARRRFEKDLTLNAFADRFTKLVRACAA